MYKNNLSHNMKKSSIVAHILYATELSIWSWLLKIQDLSVIPVIVTKNVYKKLHNRNKKGTKNGH